MTEKMKVGFNRFVAHLNRYFQEYVELVPAMVLFIFGVVTALPKELLPAPASSVYVSNLAKLIFGLIIMLPGVTIFWLRLRHGMQKYTFLKTKARRRAFFYMTIMYIYMGVLSAFNTPYPPRWALFIAMGLISLLCYLRLSKHV